MTEVVIRAVEITLAPEVNIAICAELAKAGVAGTVFMGEANGLPDTVCMMWMVRDDPVMLAVDRVELSDVQRAVVVARELLDMIQERTKGVAPLDRPRDGDESEESGLYMHPGLQRLPGMPAYGTPEWQKLVEKRGPFDPSLTFGDFIEGESGYEQEPPSETTS